MKMKTQLTLAAVVAAGLLASGCSQQMVGQQVAQAAPEVPMQETKTVVKYDCSSCKKPAAPAPAKPRPSGHFHPAIPGCTKSVRHNHKTARGGAHSHKYSCRKAPAPVRAPKPISAPKKKVMSGHVHPAVPGCTKSVRHNHRGSNAGHRHRYACKKAAAAPKRQAGHVHKAIPGCTDSFRHDHPTARGSAHSHRYNCGQRRAAQQPRRVAPQQRRLAGHFHAAIPGCTNSVRHNHPNRGAHSHKYSCRRAAPQQQRRPAVVRVPTPKYQQMASPKPKGNFKGAIKIDSMMQQYQQ